MAKSKTKTKKHLISDAPWRYQDDGDADKFQDANLNLTNPGSGQTSTITHKNRSRSRNGEDDDSLPVIGPQIRYGFHRNSQFLQRVFTIDTLVKPLPPVMAYSVTRNLSFFTRVFTQFFDPKGIARAQKSLGIGPEE